MVLVVDDDEGIVQLLDTALSHKGYRVQTAFDGAEAYGHLKDPACKCMLLDMNMPRINGAELLLLMQADGIRVPTIVMAGFQDFDEEEIRQFENVVKFMPKPFKLDEMLEAISRYARPPTQTAG